MPSLSFRLIPLVAATMLAVAAPALAKDGGLMSAPEFLAKHAKAKGVTVIPGIQYRVLASGPATGAHPSRKDDVVVRYAGKLTDGTEFDSSAKGPDGTATFPLGRLIPGWTTAVPMMRPGDKWEIVVPPEMAYGEKGVGPIPPNSVLIFEVELVSMTPHVDTPPAKPN